jgi:ATP/maltotriose-dependent transcriptional regulator MalT
MAEIQATLAVLAKIQEMALEGAVQAHFAFALFETRAAEHFEQALAVARPLTARGLIYFWGALTQAALVRTLLARGEVEAAETEARQAAGMMEPVPLCSLVARALWSMALLARGRADEARVQADVGLAILRAFDGRCFYDVTLLLTAAEAYHATGDLTAARTHLATARRLIDARAAQITDPEARERYLHQVGDHARVLELEQRW